MELIKLIPKTSRAKNRVREHGTVFRVLRRDRVQCFNNRMSIHVRSIQDDWQGWFAIEDEDWQEER